jgi:hypothetical protein
MGCDQPGRMTPVPRQAPDPPTRSHAPRSRRRADRRHPMGRRVRRTAAGGSGSDAGVSALRRQVGRATRERGKPRHYTNRVNRIRAGLVDSSNRVDRGWASLTDSSNQVDRPRASLVDSPSRVDRPPGKPRRFFEPGRSHLGQASPGDRRPGSRLQPRRCGSEDATGACVDCRDEAIRGTRRRIGWRR